MVEHEAGKKNMCRVQKKKRSAQMLFAKDTPFKPKIIVSKTVYKRSSKHRVKYR